ncbi:MAG: class I SAM-dependent rRNA methyltransferase [Balneolaceae bacterium]
MSLPHITLKRGKDKRVLNGHDWVFSNEIESMIGAPGVGDWVEVRRNDTKLIGFGFYHPHALIAVRILTRSKPPEDAALFADRIRSAVGFRDKLFPGAGAVRLIHGESDGMPGLIVDRIGNWLTVQVNSAGFEKRLDLITELLQEIVKPEGILFRNDSYQRKLEELEEYVKAVPETDTVGFEIDEYGLTYKVDLIGGQKTGFYIDQRENRRFFRGLISEGDKVYDGFCNDGGFAMNAALAGAEVMAADISAPALARAKENAVLNGLDGKISFMEGDLMKHPELIGAGGPYDVINLDPPNFARNKKSAIPALKGYIKLHGMAIKGLKEGGILCTASCSHHIREDRFLDTVMEAAQKRNRKAIILHRAFQPADHPILASMPETGYLKFMVFRII